MFQLYLWRYFRDVVNKTPLQYKYSYISLIMYTRLVLKTNFLKRNGYFCTKYYLCTSRKSSSFCEKQRNWLVQYERFVTVVLFSLENQNKENKYSVPIA